MSAPALSLDTDQIAEHNAWLETQTAEQRVAWALKHGPAEAAMSSSFGAQAAVLIEKLASLPPVPGALDQIVQRFGTDLVAEVTGRSRRWNGPAAAPSIWPTSLHTRPA